MDELSPKEKAENTLSEALQNLDRADWEIRNDRRPELSSLKESLSATMPNSGALNYITPGMITVDLTSISNSTGIRCMRFHADQLPENGHKVPMDRALTMMSLAKVSEDNPDQVWFPYAYTPKDSETKIHRMYMDIGTFANISSQLFDTFNKDQVYNQQITKEE